SGAGVGGAIASHHNGIQNFINTNSYSVNNFWGKTHTFNAAEVSATMPDGSAIEAAEQVDALFAVGSAAEAAWKATNSANGSVYYKLDADKGVVFGTATNRVQKIIITGVAEDVKYLNVGDTLDLAVYADYDIAITEGYESAIVEGVLTVPNADVTITLTEKVAIVLGDAKEDGVINLVDAIAVLRGSVDLDTDVNVANGDVNANGVLDANDAVLIVRFWLNDPAYDGPQLG
ncbi:MAG: hypothetical protein IJN34_02710, partial [Clostridia bacterium]|nr:hypothetical protein [Clostridia bacterium]